MKFVILRKSFGCESYEVYYTLKAESVENALVEAAEYLSDDGAPATGEPEDVCIVAHVISKPITAGFSVLVATIFTKTENDKKQAKDVLLEKLRAG